MYNNICTLSLQGFTEITADSDDSLDSSSSCSVEDDGETSDDDDVQKRNTCNQLKPILVYPSSTDDVKETINLTFPQKSEEKSYMKLDDYDFRALTKENTLRNRANITSSLRSLLVRVFSRYNHNHYTIL